MSRRLAVAAISVIAVLALAPPASADLFGPRVPFGVGSAPRGMAAGDLNRDGITDLVTANNTGADASLLMGLPAGGFAPATPIPVGAATVGVVVADFNGDNDADLAFAANTEVPILLGGPGVTFGAPTTFDGLGLPVDLEAADFNGDGDLDLVVTSQFSGRILLGGAGGSFSPQVPFGVSMGLLSVAVGDFDQDLALDLAFAGSDASAPFIFIWRGTGNGTFAPANNVAAFPTARVLQARDINHDGDLDLVSAGTQQVQVFYGGPGTGFPSKVVTAAPGAGFAVGTGDFNGDDDIDIAYGAGSGQLAVVLGGPGDTLQPAKLIDIGGPLTGLVAGRLNGDDRDDVAVVSSSGNAVSLLPNTSVAAIETSLANLTFPTQARGTLSGARRVTVLSTGERPLHVRAVRTLGLARDSYVITGDHCSGETVPAGGTCTFAVRFAPENAGAHEADLHVVSDAASNPVFSMSLNGTGGALPAGATGPAGPPGRSGSATVRDRLAAAFATDRMRIRGGRRLRMRFVSTLAGVATLELRRGTRALRRISVAVEPGLNTARLAVPRKRGPYTLALTVTGGGETVTDAARLTVVRRPA